MDTYEVNTNKEKLYKRKCFSSYSSTWYPKGVEGMDPKLGIHAITNSKIFYG